MSARTASENQDLISRALCEVLDSIVAPRVRELVLDDALALAHRGRLPTDPEQLRRFMHGALRDVLVQTVGEASVDALMLDFDRIVELAEGPTRKRSTMESAAISGDRRRSASTPRFPVVAPGRTTPLPRARAATPRPPWRASTPRFPASFAPPRAPSSIPPVPSGPYPRGAAAALAMAGARSSFPPDVDEPRSLVAIVSTRPRLAYRFAKSLEASVELMTIRSAAELVRELDADSDCRAVLLLDCVSPSVRPVAVAALIDDLPRKLQVVLWGASPELRAQLLAISPRCQTWFGVESDAEVDDVAGRCALFVC